MLVNAPAQSTPGARPDLETIRERSADAEARLRMHVDTIAASFGSEIRDQRWSTETAESLRTALASEPLASTPVESIDCRTTTCRVELQDDGSGAVLQAIPMLAVQMGGTLPNLIAQSIDHPNGRAVMVLYMSR